MADQTKQGPDTAGKVHERQKDALDIVRDVWSGTLELRKKKTKYLPRFPKEADAGYETRVKTAVLFNALKRTVRGLSGMVFRKDPVLGDETPEQVLEHLENVDLTGRDLSVFARDLFDDGMLDGHAVIFVDMDPPDPEIETRGQEREAGRRPYWVIIKKEQILAADGMKFRGKILLTRLRYKETLIEKDGDFGDKEVEQIREYRLKVERPSDEDGDVVRLIVTFQKWRKDEKDTEFSPAGPPEDMQGMSRIPAAPFYTGRVGFYESEPPLLDLALENIRHFQLRSDRDNSMHIAGVPIPIFTGVSNEDEITVGSGIGYTIPDPNGKAFYLEPEGSALEETRKELLDIEKRMAALGLAMLQRDSRAAETAEARRIDKSESDSALSSAARNLQGAIDEALAIHGEWLELDNPGSVTVNRDFESLMLDPQMVSVLQSMVPEKLSIDTLWDILSAGEVLPDDFDPELEKQRLEQGDAQALARLRGFIQREEGAA